MADNIVIDYRTRQTYILYHFICKIMPLVSGIYWYEGLDL